MANIEPENRLSQLSSVTNSCLQDLKNEMINNWLASTMPRTQSENRDYMMEDQSPASMASFKRNSTFCHCLPWKGQTDAWNRTKSYLVKAFRTKKQETVDDIDEYFRCLDQDQAAFEYFLTTMVGPNRGCLGSTMSRGKPMFERFYPST